MKRRNTLKNIGMALSLPLIPIGLMAKEERVNPEKARLIHKFGHNPSVDDKIEDILTQTDKDAAYLNHIYPQRWEFKQTKNGEVRFIGTSEWDIEI